MSALRDMLVSSKKKKNADMPHINTQATPGDNSIDHTVRAVHSHPGLREEAETVQIYTSSQGTGRRGTEKATFEGRRCL